MKALLAVLAAFAAVSAVASDPIAVPMKKYVQEYINTQYAGVVKIGTQNFKLIFDTSAYATVVTKGSCVSGGCQCVLVRKFYPTKDTRVNSETVAINILDTAHANGTQANDNIQISTLTAENQGFLLATDISTDICVLDADGVVGMGRPGSSKRPFGMPTILETLAASGQIDPSFVFYHGRGPTGIHNGLLLLGGTSPNFYKGELTYVPLVDDDTWNFKVNSIEIDGTTVVTDTLAFIDSSKYVVVGPHSVIDPINEKLSCTYEMHGSTKLCVVSCDNSDNLPDVILKLEGFEMPLKAEHYVQQNGDLCYTGYAPIEGMTTMGLGDFIIDNYHALHEATEKRIGFAHVQDHDDIPAEE